MGHESVMRFSQPRTRNMQKELRKCQSVRMQQDMEYKREAPMVCHHTSMMLSILGYASEYKMP